VTWQVLVYEWANTGARWLHVIAAMAWIGSSFYFVHLDLSLQKRPGLPGGVAGEAWQVHGGGFYNMLKYAVAPAHMAADLTWFKWEAYTTFLSGFALLCILYGCNAELYLIDKTIWDAAPWQAAAAGLLWLAGGWLVYDNLYRTPLAKNDKALLAAVFLLLVLAGFALTKIFSGRGAFMELGAMTGTIMAANVAMNIIPNQRKTVAALLKGEVPDPAFGKAAKQRSLHNNYLTLPTLFLMLANHSPLAFATRWNWAIAAIVLVIGAAIRHFFNERHAGRPAPWWTWGVAAVGFAVIIWLSSAGPASTRASMTPSASTAPGVNLDDVQGIVVSHCAMCHAREPVWPGIHRAPDGVILETPGEVLRHAHEIGLQAVWTHAMPPGGNITELPDEDRATLAAWLNQDTPER
jgi:uncharacterized membrane protein